MLVLQAVSGYYEPVAGEEGEFDAVIEELEVKEIAKDTQVAAEGEDTAEAKEENTSRIIDPDISKCTEECSGKCKHDAEGKTEEKPQEKPEPKELTKLPKNCPLNSDVLLDTPALSSQAG